VLPRPRLTIEGLSVGSSADLVVGTVHVTPDLFSLLGDNKVVKNIAIDDLVMTQKAIDSIPVWTKPAVVPGETAQPVTWRIEAVRLNNALLKMDSASFGPFDAKVDLDAKGEPENASVTTRDGKLKADIKPGPSGYLLEVNAKGWSLPIGPAVMFDELSIKGSGTPGDANLSEISGKLYGGTVTGSAVVGWRNRLQLKGNLDINEVELSSIAPMFSPNTHVSGRLNAKPSFLATAADAAQLKEAMRLETSFSVQNGIIHGVDIQKAASSLISRGATAGGETKFDQLSGNLNMDHGSYRFTQLKIASGALAVDGDVTISPKKELSGRIDTKVKALGLSTGVPLNVAGSLDSPLLYPTGATLTGAAVGTALLGPGVGTTVGVKAGNFVEGLFGKKDAKPKK
jgi:hypothetical protein